MHASRRLCLSTAELWVPKVYMFPWENKVVLNTVLSATTLTHDWFKHCYIAQSLNQRVIKKSNLVVVNKIIFIIINFVVFNDCWIPITTESEINDDRVCDLRWFQMESWKVWIESIANLKTELLSCQIEAQNTVNCDSILPITADGWQRIFERTIFITMNHCNSYQVQFFSPSLVLPYSKPLPSDSRNVTNMPDWPIF
jgi:hypothetical protein